MASKKKEPEVTDAQRIFAKRLHRIRTKLDLSHVELARITNITAPTVSLLETCKRTPSMEMIDRLSKALGVEPWQLFKNPSKEDQT